MIQQKRPMIHLYKSKLIMNNTYLKKVIKSILKIFNLYKNRKSIIRNRQINLNLFNKNLKMIITKLMIYKMNLKYIKIMGQINYKKTKMMR